MPSRTTVRVLSTNISKTEGCGVGEAVGRPPGLPQRPLPNQPRFGVFLDPELPLMTLAPLDAARDPSSRTSVRLLPRHRPDRSPPHESAVPSGRLPGASLRTPGIGQARDRCVASHPGHIAAGDTLSNALSHYAFRKGAMLNHHFTDAR